MTELDIYILIITILFLIFLAACVCATVSRRILPPKAQRWLCSPLGWHDGAGNWTYKGSNLHDRCSFCGVNIVMNRQGDWVESD